MMRIPSGRRYAAVAFALLAPAVAPVCLPSSIGAALAAVETPAAPTIAVCNLERVLEQSQYYLSSIEGLRKERASVEAQLKELTEKLQSLETTLQALPAGNPRIAQMQEDFEITKVRREGIARRASGDLERRHSQLVKDSFQWLRTRLGEFCKERGIRLVLQSQSGEVNGASTVELNVNLGLQTVLYADPAHDVTDAVIAYVNDRFTKDKEAKAKEPAKAGPAPAPAPAGPPTGTAP